MGLGFKWREPIRNVSPFLEEEFDSLYAALQTSGVWNDAAYQNPGWISTLAASKVTGLYFNVKTYGAVGNGSTDDTVAIQAAINAAKAAGRGTVFFPDGEYLTTATLVVDASRITLRGTALGASILYPKVGDAIDFGPSCQRVGIHDLTIYGWGELTSGALVHCSRCDMVWMSNVEIASGYGGLWLESVTNSAFSNVQIRSDSAFTALRTDSYLLRVSQHASGRLPSELHFTNCDWRGQNGNNRLDYGVRLEAVDGIWFTNVHIGFTRVAGIALLPDTAARQVSAVNLSNCYLDTVQGAALLAQEPVSYAGPCGFMLWNGGHIYNCGTGIDWDLTATLDSLVSDVSLSDTPTPTVFGAGAETIRFDNCVTDADVETINASGAEVLTIPVFASVFKLGNDHPVSSIATGSGWKGRLVHLVAVTGVTVNDGGNLKLTSTWTMDADDVLGLVYDGANWFEVSRSAN